MLVLCRDCVDHCSILLHCEFFVDFLHTFSILDADVGVCNSNGLAV